MTPTFLDHWRVQSDFRRLKGRGTLLDWVFLRLRNWWLTR